MDFVDAGIDGLVLIVPRRIGDGRGYFAEAFRRDLFRDRCGPYDFVQENESLSVEAGTVRGLHFQNPKAQGKLVSVLEGEVWDVAVDIRRGSPDYGRWTGVVLSEANKRHLWIPEGFAHGFVTLSERALFTYLCTDTYDPAADAGIRWDDPRLAIDWPVAQPLLSDKDARLPLLDELPPERLPLYEA